MNYYNIYFAMIGLASAYMSVSGDELGAIWTLLLGIFMFVSIICQRLKEFKEGGNE